MSVVIGTEDVGRIPLWFALQGTPNLTLTSIRSMISGRRKQYSLIWSTCRNTFNDIVIIMASYTHIKTKSYRSENQQLSKNFDLKRQA